jgi:hypothetical protein
MTSTSFDVALIAYQAFHALVDGAGEVAPVDDGGVKEE